MKTIECAIGHIMVGDSGEFYYFGGPTFNGKCFKDYKAWEEGKGVIYISEYELQDIAAELHNPIWTRESWEYEVADELKVQDYPEEMWNNKAFVSALAYYVLMICDWQDLPTYLDEMTCSDDIEDMFYGRGFFTNIEKKW